MRSLDQAEDIDLDMVNDNELIKHVTSNLPNKPMTQSPSKQQISEEKEKESTNNLVGGQSSEDTKIKNSL